MARRAIHFGDADLVTTYRSDHGALFREATLFDAARNLNIMNLSLLAPNSGIGEVLEPFAQRIVDWMRSSS